MRRGARAAKRGLVDLWLVAPVVGLVVVGVWLVFDASYARAADSSWMGKDPWYLAKRQIAYAIIGFGVMYLVSRMRLRTVSKLALAAAIISIVLLALVLVPGIGTEVNGARRWFRFHGVTLQPSEIAKIALVMYLAGFLAQGRKVLQHVDERWLAPALIVGATAGFILKEPDMGTTIAIVLAVFAMLFAAGMKKWQLAALLTGCGLGGAVLVSMRSYRMDRIDVWLHPWEHRYDEGYQIVHSLIALGTGGLRGVGLCEGREKLYIPAASTDFIFCTPAEELGLIGCLILLAAFVFFIYKGLDVARRAKDIHASLLAVGITSMIGLQALINVAVVSSSIPATGVPLPFISYGGSSLVFTLAGVGILLAISRHASETDT